MAARAGVDRKTARRYVDAAVAAGLDRECGVEQLSDELIGAVVTAVRPDCPRGHGATTDGPAIAAPVPTVAPAPSAPDAAPVPGAQSWTMLNLVGSNLQDAEDAIAVIDQ